MRILFVLALCAAPAAAQTTGGTISGELRKWHRVTVTFDGPSTSETATTNPFRNYRLDVTFTKGTRSIKVPGFYAADGNAAESSSASGTKWRVHFTPDEEGTWSYSASFRTGTDIAISTSATAGSATAFNGASGSFNVGATNKTGRDHRGKGRLRYVGKHHLQFAQTGEWFIKGGADSPENFLAYFEFDGTPTTKHKYAPHAGDWKTGDPTWKSGKGKNIIGALNYLSGKGMNSVYFLTMNVNGDGKDVWPWTADTERYRFDVSKLDQWEIVLSHMDKLGIQLHVVTQETENDQLLDGGSLGVQRKLYYRELVARFAHHLGIVWNIGEENTNTDAQRKDFATWIRGLDPYDHPIVIHTYPGQYDAVYAPLLGHAAYEGPSLQMGSRSATHSETVKWVKNSAANGRRWFVCLDEIGGANEGVKPDADDFWHDTVRTQALWGNLMGGGAGCEWYFGYGYAHSDLTCEDWRSRDHMWDLTRIAMDFFRQHLPFQDMTPNDGLVSTGWCLNKGGEVYAVYLPSGGTASLNVGTGTYSVKWFDPRNGGALLNGSVTSITGSGSKGLGNPPNNSTKDWAVLVALTSGGGTTPPPTGPSVTSFTLINADSDQDLGTLANGQSINLATLPTRNLNVRANVSGTVGSVRFGYDANANYKTESVAPYALEGDTNGNYNAWTPSVGTHTLTGTAYTEASGGGTAGTAHTVTFTVVDDAANTPPSVSISSPANNATFAAGTNITITANASDPDGTVSFVDFYRGATLIGMDTASPWSVTWSNVPAGTYVLTAKATDNDAATATSGPVTITVTASGGQAVSSLILINADTDQPITGFNPIANGATINLDALPTRNLNMRADTSPATVGSVRFGYDANANVRTENAAPYALAGDSSGNYYAWTPATGSHSVTATPYTGANAGGTAGTAKTITFTVTSTAAASASAGAPWDPGATGPESGTGVAEPVAAASEDRDGGVGADCGALGLELFLGLGLAAAVRSRRRLGWAVGALILLGAGLSADAQVYQESGGIVVIEVESHPVVSSWTKQTSIAGYTGSGYYNWSGNNVYNAGQTGTQLAYRINITNAGEYQLRIRNYHDHPTDNTLGNDCWTRMDGGSWIKTYSSSGNAFKWNWATTHEPTSGTHITPKYTLAVGEHTFYLSGRSQGFKVDRIHLHLPNVSGATDHTRPESLTTPGGGSTTPPPPTGGDTGGGDTGGGGTGGGSTGGTTGGAATLPSGPDRPNDPDGCGGRIASPGTSWAWMALGLLLLVLRRR